MLQKTPHQMAWETTTKHPSAETARDDCAGNDVLLWLKI